MLLCRMNEDSIGVQNGKKTTRDSLYNADSSEKTAGKVYYRWEWGRGGRVKLRKFDRYTASLSYGNIKKSTLIGSIVIVVSL